MPLIFSLNSTQAALTRASRSDRRLLDAVSLSDNYSRLRMGCICCIYPTLVECERKLMDISRHTKPKTKIELQGLKQGSI
ncbi:MAG: hypothetical protein MRZ90_07695 [Candidatus Gastranaerophilales bacterium]|nr:hypothetical protein [Candidatus Gastranaerophilales bacterium]